MGMFSPHIYLIIYNQLSLLKHKLNRPKIDITNVKMTAYCDGLVKVDVAVSILFCSCAQHRTPHLHERDFINILEKVYSTHFPMPRTGYSNGISDILMS